MPFLRIWEPPSFFRFLLIKRKMASKETRRGVEEEDLANVEFETSEDVEVIPTFDSMALREDLLRWRFLNIIFLHVMTWPCNLLQGHLCLRIWKAICHPAESNQADHQGKRCDRPGAIWYRQNSHLLHLYPAGKILNTSRKKLVSCTIFSLQSIDTTVRETQVLCLSPTRELAVQIQKVICY